MILETLSMFLTFAFVVLGALFLIFMFIRHDEPGWTANHSAVAMMFSIVFFFLALLCAFIGGI